MQLCGVESKGRDAEGEMWEKGGAMEEREEGWRKGGRGGEGKYNFSNLFQWTTITLQIKYHLMLNDVLVLHEYTQELINADILAALVLWPFITVAIQPTQLHGTRMPQLTSVRSLVS